MTRKLTATETKARILSLIEEVAAGEEVEITKHGRTVALWCRPEDRIDSKGNSLAWP
jgi:antitoxin (DNA-binding transcriptional repressor) of toxin-antitoxin stability system